MIEKMTRYDFIVLKQDSEAFLEKLQALGMIDITRSTKPVDDKSSALFERSGKLSRAISVLKGVDFTADQDADAIKEAGRSAFNCDDPVEETFTLTRRLDELKNTLTSAKRELTARLAWGEYDSASVGKLAEEGVILHWYCVYSKQFDPQWGESVPLEVISNDGRKVCFVTVSKEGDEYDFPVQECPAPAGSPEDQKKVIDDMKAESIRCKAALTSLKDRIPELQKQCSDVLTDLDYHFASISGESAAEDHITVLSGFAPSSCDISSSLDELGALWFKRDAVLEDKPPIKLKNNRFSKQFEVFTSMYGMPSYNEFDPSVFLSIFYLLFFAICMGDAGYGILLMLIGFFLKGKEGGLAKLWNLIVTLGAGTFAVGLLMGGFFGVDLTKASWIPDGLRKCMVTGEIAGYSTQMVFALGIGVLHLCLAMLMKAIWSVRKNGFKESISTIGWTLLIVGSVIVLATALVGLVDETTAKWIIIGIAGVSALGIFIFNKLGRNPLINIGSGLWDTYGMASGLIGDVLSYIRLYALGLSGSMLGSTFNLLGTMVRDSGLPVVNWIGFLLIVIIGHALNLALSSLGAFVHPLRLNFVEFFKNSGYEGSGKEYNPFNRKQ